MFVISDLEGRLRQWRILGEVVGWGVWGEQGARALRCVPYCFIVPKHNKVITFWYLLTTYIFKINICRQKMFNGRITLLHLPPVSSLPRHTRRWLSPYQFNSNLCTFFLSVNQFQFPNVRRIGANGNSLSSQIEEERLFCLQTQAIKNN